MRKRLTYLACPYSHKDRYMMVARHLLVNRFAAKLMAEGHFVFSPISHTHPIADEKGLPRGWQFWECYDKTMIGCCDDLLVLTLPGWETSTGVQAEIQIAQDMGIPIDYAQYELTPTIDQMVERAKALEEFHKARTSPNIRLVEGNSLPFGAPSFSSAYDSQGVCVSPTDVTAQRFGLLHGV